MRRALNPNLRAASCCNVEVVNGGAGLRRRCLRSIANDAQLAEASCPGARRGAGRRFDGSLDFARLRLVDEAELLDLLAAVFDQLERKGLRGVRAFAVDRPVFLRNERRDLASRSQIIRSAGLCTRPADSPWRTFFHSSGDRLNPTR